MKMDKITYKILLQLLFQEKSHIGWQPPCLLKLRDKNTEWSGKQLLWNEVRLILATFVPVDHHLCSGMFDRTVSISYP